MHTRDRTAEDLLYEIPSESLQQVIIGTYRPEWKIPDLSLQSQLLCQVRCASQCHSFLTLLSNEMINS